MHIVVVFFVAAVIAVHVVVHILIDVISHHHPRWSHLSLTCQEGIVPRLALLPPIGRYLTQSSCPDVNFVVVVVVLSIFVIVVLSVFVLVIIESTPPSLPEMHRTTRLVVISKNKVVIIILARSFVVVIVVFPRCRPRHGVESQP